MSDQEFVEYVVKALVDHPDEVSVKRSVDDMGVLIELEVNPEDMGKVIGKDGRTAKSIRTLLRVFGAKNDERVNMKIVEPLKEGGAPAESAAPKPSEEEAPAEEPLDDVPAEPSEDVPEATSDVVEAQPEAAPIAEEAPAKKRDHLAGLEDSPLDSFEI